MRRLQDALLLRREQHQPPLSSNKEEQESANAQQRVKRLRGEAQRQRRGLLPLAHADLPAQEGTEG